MSDVEGGDPLARAARLLWPNLPVLLIGSVLVAATWVLLRLFAGALGVAGLVALGLVVVPVFAIVLHGGDVLLAGEHFGVRRLVLGAGRTIARAWRVTAPLTVVALLTEVAVRTWQLSGQAWALGSAAVCGALLCAGSVIAVVALPYAVRTGATVREVWPVALFVATRNPVLTLGMIAAAGLAVWAAAYLSFALLILLPAPLALIWAAAASMAVDRSRGRLAARAGTSPAGRPF